MVINIQEPPSNDKDCNKNRWGQGIKMILWQWSGGRFAFPFAFFVCFVFVLLCSQKTGTVSLLPVFNPGDWLQCHECGACCHKSVRGASSWASPWATRYYNNCFFPVLLLLCPICMWHLKMKLAFEISASLFSSRTLAS